ncbi:conserved protein of unknown function [Petrocella atlantisensis]|uniref:6-hydroxymethylpterin diphosphokinase MptE-like domain-containing protein n=1 Tax=Petrocella atlantisensis TaxID=2173034 RepID=A0A3P7PY15_9FIRM|nr:6-hydroxymethylpterin diphosphokinase MptE-like protein [Petrocella atlantisensis]VDN48537.1 conserved protein of unknown function [Petrocella atlantisensis]
MYYDKNISVIKNKYPRLYEELEGIKVDKQLYEVMRTKTNDWTVRVNKEEGRILIHSLYNPKREARKIVEDLYDSTASNYVFIGMGFGYHILELMLLSPNTTVYIAEMNMQLLKLALEYMDLEQLLLNENIKLYPIDDIKKLSTLIESFTFHGNYKIVIHPPLLNALPEKYLSVKLLLEEFSIKVNSSQLHERTMEDNYYNNISLYNESIEVLFGKAKDKPIFIVAAGPSLDKNITELRAIGEKGIILAVGRAVKPLVEAKVKMDYIIVSESSPLLYGMQLENVNVNCPIIALSTSDRKVFEYYSGFKYIALQKDYELAEKFASTHGLQLVETGGSVATTALDVAIKMGCNPIIFVGQDLAFTNNKTHANHTSSLQIKESKKLRWVTDIKGEKVQTSINLNIYLKWIQDRIRREKEIVFIDATEGGAKIEGTKIMKLKNAIEEYCYQEKKEI